MADDGPEITRLIRLSREGNAAATDELVELVYDDLKHQARRALRGERVDHSLEPTALVHEAWVRLDAAEDLEPRDRGHFHALAARTMRRILSDHARARRREKRGGGAMERSLPTAVPFSDDPVDILTVVELLDELDSLNARHARITELRVFGGMSLPEVAQTLEVSLRTVEADWRFAKTWLGKRLDARENQGPVSDDGC